MDNELNNLNDDNKIENNNGLLENNNQDNQINYKSNKWKKILIGIIVLIVIFIIALTIYVFVINKDNKEQGNGNVEDNNQSISYKMEKILDSLENEHTANSIKETEKYYILKTDNKVILYDKNGKDVTKQVFGTSDISSIYGVTLFKIKTKDGRQGLYDKNFNQIIGLGNYILYEPYNVEYLYIADSEDFRPIGNVGVYNLNGELLIPREYERLDLIKNAGEILFYTSKNGKYGIIDEKNNVIIPFEYDAIPDTILFYSGVDYAIKAIGSNENKYYILLKNGKYGMVDSNNNVIIDFDKDRLSYSKYANAVIEEDNKSKKINVYNLNGELKKTIDLGNSLSYEVGVEYYKLDTDDYIFYDDEYIYLLNSDFEFEKYIKPFNFSSGGGDSFTQRYFAGPNVYLKSDDGLKVKIYNAKDNSLMFKEEFYLINEDVSQDIQTFILCKDMLGYDSYSKCGIIGYDGKIISDFNYSTINGLGSATYNLLYQNEVIMFKYNPVDGGGKYYMKKNAIGSIDGNCMINDKLYEVENNIAMVYDENTESVYNSSCNLILNSETNDYSKAYSLNEDLVMTEKKQSSKPNIYKIYNTKDGKQVNIGSDDKAVITNGVIGRTLNNEPIVSTDKGIYKIVKE